jgi:uncharacterized protein (TIGR01777 family)
MKILITGASGLIGNELKKHIEAKGHSWSALTRQEDKLDERHIFWNIEEKRIEKDRLEGFDAIVHLAGDSIADGRWNDEKKQKIRDSRVHGTQFLVETIKMLEHKPKVFVSASAIGFYGDRPGEELTEEASAQDGNFLSMVCREWEAATDLLKAEGIRVALLRTGIVLSPDGGALKQMLLPFKLGLGGQLGDGKQYMSWIDIYDMAAIYMYAIENEQCEHAINAVAPYPVTNKEYTKVLGDVISRPTIFPVPEFGLKALFGEMADALLLADVKVIPAKLEKSSFQFRYPDLKASLEHLLNGRELHAEDPTMQVA